jgi:hypothetical protein
MSDVTRIVSANPPDPSGVRRGRWVVVVCRQGVTYRHTFSQYHAARLALTRLLADLGAGRDPGPEWNARPARRGGGPGGVG